MDVESLAKQLILKGMTKEQQSAVLESIKGTMLQARAVQKQRVGENVQVVVQALKKLEADIKARYDETGKAIEKRVASIKDGKDGQNGINGKDGRDGRPGRDGSAGQKGNDGLPGRNGIDGVDGVSVTNAYIDFDGSLIINLSSGQTLNVGEVVAPDLAEKIQVITNGGGTSQQVLDTLISLQNQINNLIPSQTGNAGNFLTTDGTDVSWSPVAGALDFQGTWNASTNTPTLASGVGVSGEYYITDTAGSTNLDGITDWQIGDWLLFNGTVWQKLDQSNLVTSVNGQTGSVTVGTVTSVSGTGTVSGISLSGTVTSSGSLTLGGTLNLSSPPTIGNTTPNTGRFTNLTVDDNTTLGTSNTDNVTFNARIASEFTPATDNAFDLGSSGREWRDLFIDGTANIDSLIADTADINAGTIDGTTIGASTASTGAFTTLTSNSTTTLNGTTIPASVTLVSTAATQTLTNKTINLASNTLVSTSNQLRSAVTDETGTGSLVFATSPTLVTPALGTPSSGTLTNCTFPTLNQNTTGTAANVTGTVAVLNGGTGQTSYTNGELLIGNTTGNTLTKATLTAGSGVTITNGSGAITIAATSGGGTVTSVSGTGTVQGLSLSGTVTSSGNLTLGGSLSAVSLTTQVSGTLPVANGGTGITSLGAGIATFLGTPSSANLKAAVTNETGSGALVFATSPTLVTPALGTPSSGTLTNCTFPTLNQNTTGTAANVTGTVAVANGGTGRTSLTANNVLLGNGTSALQVVAPGTSGNVLTSNGSTWTSAASPAPTIASTAEAEAGTNNTKFITPLRMREGFNASGSAPVFAARAWVNFNGTGTVAIRASGNVSSISDNGTGDYTVNFATAMPDADYSVGTSVDGDNATSVSPRTFTTTSFALRAATGGGGATPTDYATISSSVFR